MRLSFWSRRPSRQQQKPRPRLAPALRLEVLEDRAVPSASAADPAQGYTLTILGGSGQVAPIGTSFDNRLQVLVEYNGQPVPQARVLFTTPSSGPGGDFGWGFNMFPIPSLYPLTSIVVLADENGVATTPTFEGNGVAGTFTVTADLYHDGTSPVSFILANGVFPGPLPPRVSQQLLLDLAARPSFTDPQSQSELGNQFGTLFALSYMQSPQQATQLFWQEVNLTRDLILAGGDFYLFQNNLPEWKLSYEISLNPLYNTVPGYGMALLECEAILASVQ